MATSRGISRSQKRANMEIELEALENDADYFQDQLNRTRSLVRQKELELIELDEGLVVQVVFKPSNGGFDPGYRSTYAYSVPTSLEPVQIGDLLIVATPKGVVETVRVVGFGRDSYTGPVKPVLGRVTIA